MTRLRGWLHRHGYHRRCRITRKRIVQRIDFGPQYIKGHDEELIDVASFNGEPVYEDQFGKVHYEEVHA